MNDGTLDIIKEFVDEWLHSFGKLTMIGKFTLAIPLSVLFFVGMLFVGITNPIFNWLMKLRYFKTLDLDSIFNRIGDRISKIFFK